MIIGSICVLQLLKGLSLKGLKRYAEAVQLYNEALSLNPKNPNILFIKAWCLHDMEKHEEALKSIDEALFLDPKNPEYWRRKAACLHSLEKYEEALKALDEALSLDPKNPEYWQIKAAILWHMRSFQKSLESAEKALSLDANHKLSLEYKALLLITLDRAVEADLFFDQYLKAGGKKDGVCYSRACAYALLNRYDEALSNLKEAISLNEEKREEAKTDPDFKPLQGIEDFQKLINNE